MSLALLRVLYRCFCPLPFPVHISLRHKNRGSTCIPSYVGFIPSIGLSQLYLSYVSLRSCTIHSLLLQPATSVSTPDWVRQMAFTKRTSFVWGNSKSITISRHGTLSGQVRTVCYHPMPPPTCMLQRAISMLILTNHKTKIDLPPTFLL